jgi:hypothetical protein
MLEMSGIENIQGQRRGTLLIETLVSRRPVRWRVRCESCGLSTVVDHTRLQNGAVASCPNGANCGRTIQPRTPGATASVGVVPTAVRSRDAGSARQFQREQSAQPLVRWAEPSADTFTGVDPSSIRGYMDYLEE